MFVINIFQLNANETTSVTSENNVVVLDLLPFHHYLISIAAVTVMKGPFSEPIAIEMPEDGKGYLGTITGKVINFFNYSSN